MYSEQEVVVCPDCGAELESAISTCGFRAGTSSMGPPIIACPGCGVFIQTGLREWPQKNPLQRTGFVLSRLAWLAASSTFLAGGFAGVAQLLVVAFGWIAPERKDVFAIVCYVVGTVMLSVVFVRNALREIRESKRRFRSPEFRALFAEANPFPGLADDCFMTGSETASVGFPDGGNGSQYVCEE